MNIIQISSESNGLWHSILISMYGSQKLIGDLGRSDILNLRINGRFTNEDKVDVSGRIRMLGLKVRLCEVYLDPVDEESRMELQISHKS